MAGNVRGVMVKDMDMSALFEKYSIEEIREIEKKTRQDIEKKKEDLRQMVGERYRELIEAADTISEMKRSSESVTLSIAKIQGLCQSLKQSLTSSSGRPPSEKLAAKGNTRPGDVSKLYGMSISLKMLMDSPEKIWSALDAGQYLLATRLYLLSRYIYTTLQLEGQGVQIASQFPVMARQWATIGHFKTTILQSCQARLKDIGVSDETVSECLCSILLLEDYTVEQTFEQFISARLDSVQQLFQLDQADVVIRSQISSVIMMIASTIRQIYTVFHHELVQHKEGSEIRCNLLMSMLDQVTSKSSSGAILSSDDLSKSSQKYLSKAILDFRPSLRHRPQPIASKILKDRSRYFLDRCLKNVNDDVVKLLGFITSIRGLASIRDDIWEILRRDERMADWNIISEQVLGRSLSVWHEVMRGMFVSRVKEILKNHFASMLSSIKLQIGKVLTDLGNTDDRMLQCERDLSSYVWTEGAQDIPTNRAWLRVSQWTLAEGGSLMMKAHAYTPKVQALCAAMDQDLRVLLEDSYHYTTHQPNGDGAQVVGTGDGKGFEPFERFGDKEAIHEFLQNACEDYVTKLLDHLKQQLYACKKQLVNSQDRAGNEIIINRVLLLGRVSGAICDLSSHLQTCMSVHLGDDQPPTPGVTRSARKTGAGAQASKMPQNPRLNQMQSQLVAFSLEAFSVWSESTSDYLTSEFANILKDKSVRAILSSCTQWDSIDIEEETEDERKVKSTIRVPMQASWYVQTLLYNLCLSVNRTGGHSLHYSVLSSLMQKLTDGILTSYESLLSTSFSSSSSSSSLASLTQNRSLQLWFDVKFLMNLLLRRDDSEMSKAFQKRHLRILEQLESKIDPFDFDVFYHHLQNHLARQTTRSNVLYGLLCVGEKTSVGGSSAASQQEQHNILPLSASQNRFSLLPLSIHKHPPSTLNPIIQPPKLKPVTALNTVASAPVLPSRIAPPRVTSSSFLEQMSTMWFSNVK